MAKKVVRELSIRKKRGEVLIVAYSSTDRGQKFVNSVSRIPTEYLSEDGLNAAIRASIDTMLDAQLEVVESSVNIPGTGE